MAYTAVNYTEFDPLKEFVPLITQYNKEYEEQEKKRDAYLDWISSASSLLQNDSEYQKSYNDYNTKLGLMADALAKGNLNEARSIDIRNAYAKLKQGQQQADILSALIKEQTKNADKYAYSKRYSAQTPLSEITEASSYTPYSLDEFKSLGQAFGNSLNSTSPDVAGYLFGNAIAILKSGYSQQEVLEMFKQNNSQLNQYINNIKSKIDFGSGEEAKVEEAKIDKAILQGILSKIGESYQTINNPRAKNTTGGTRRQSSPKVVDPLEARQKQAKLQQEQLRRLRNEKIDTGEFPDQSGKWVEYDEATNKYTQYWWEYDRSKGDFIKKFRDVTPTGNSYTLPTVSDPIPKPIIEVTKEDLAADIQEGVALINANQENGDITDEDDETV